MNHWCDGFDMQSNGCVVPFRAVVFVFLLVYTTDEAQSTDECIRTKKGSVVLCFDASCYCCSQLESIEILSEYLF